MKFKKLYILFGILLFIALATMWILFPFRKSKPEQRDYSQIKKEGVLRIVTEYNSSGYYVNGDTIEGFQYELSQAIAQLSGLEVEMHLDMNLTTSFEGLASGKYDIIARNIPASSDMKETYLFTDPVVLNRQVLVQRTAEANQGRKPIRNQLELAQRRLYIPKDSPAKLRIKNLSHEIGDTIYVSEDELYSTEQLIIMVAKGEIDFAVCDLQLAKKAMQQFPEIDINTDISFTQLQSWAVRKDSPVLCDSINSWFKQIKESGDYKKIYKRYYSE